MPDPKGRVLAPTPVEAMSGGNGWGAGYALARGLQGKDRTKARDMAITMM